VQIGLLVEADASVAKRPEFRWAHSAGAAIALSQSREQDVASSKGQVLARTGTDVWNCHEIMAAVSSSQSRDCSPQLWRTEKGFTLAHCSFPP
jgi:hypothetical protein